VLVCAPVLWSIFTGLTGLVESAAALVAVRFCFGLAEGSSNAACYKVVGDNFAPRERAHANSVWITALAAGPAFVAPLASWALRSVGWENMFFLFSLPGLALAVVLWFGVPAKQSVHDTDGPITHARGWLWLLRRPTSWLIFFGYLSFNIGFWGYLGWMPSYLALQRHLDIKALGVAASVPYMFGLIGILVFGWLGSGALYRFRAPLVAFGYVCAAGCLLIAFTAESVGISLVGLTGAAFFMYGGFGPYASLVLDLAPERERGGFVGFVNTGGQLGGIVAPIVIGYVVNITGSFDDGFAFMVCALAVSAGCYLGLAYFIRAQASHPATVSPPLTGRGLT
jgi:sugar phosphate permease